MSWFKLKLTKNSETHLNSSSLQMPYKQTVEQYMSCNSK